MQVLVNFYNGDENKKIRDVANATEMLPCPEEKVTFSYTKGSPPPPEKMLMDKRVKERHWVYGGLASGQTELKVIMHAF